MRPLSEACLLLALASCVAAFGGAASWVIWPLIGFSSGALCFACASTIWDGEKVRVPKLGWLFVAAVVLCALQLVPLPLPLLGLASPVAAELVRFNLQPLGLSTVRPVTLDVAATSLELAKAASYLALIIASSQLATSRSARKRLQWGVAAVGAIVSLVGAGHALVGATALFGVQAFSIPPPVLTFFGNPNHLTGFLTVTATLTLGLLVDAKLPPVRVALALGYLLQASIAVLSLSRAGIACLVFAQLLAALLILRARQAEERKRSFAMGRGVIGLIAVGTVLCAGAYVAWDGLTTEYENTNSLEKVRDSKLALWPQFARSAGEFSRFGMGRGTFELGFPHSQLEPSVYTYTHPENEVLQLWAELGIPGAAALLALGLYAFFSLFRRDEPSVLDLATLSAAVAVALHNLFDFSFELPAVPVALIILLGLVSRRGEAGRSLPPRLVWPAAALVVALAIFGAVRSRDSWLSAEDQLQALITKGAKAQDVEEAAKPLIDRHPFDPLLYTAVGLSYSNDRAADPRLALAWLNRGLLLAPWHGPSHRAAARALLRMGKRNQAFLEYRLAIESNEEIFHRGVIDEALRVAKGADELQRLAPRRPPLLLDIANRLGGAGRFVEAEGLLAAVLPELQNSIETLPLRLRLAAFQAANKKFDAAMAGVDEAEKLAPDDVRVALTRAEVLNAMGKRAEAAATLEGQIAKHPGEGGLHLALAQQYLSLGDARKAAEAAVRARPFVTDPGARVELLLTEANAYESQGRFARAVEVLQAAARLAAPNPSLYYRVADLYARLGRYDEARKWLAQGAAIDTPQGATQAKQRLTAWSAAESRAIESQTMTEDK
ncbi:MAG: tetratricopeptide repeat protein [Myxococcaceae bacterium]